MKKALIGASALIAVTSPAEAQDGVADCQADVMTYYGWSEADTRQLQPQQILIYGRPFQIRPGGTLSLACKEWAAEAAIAEAERLRKENELLQEANSLQAISIGSLRTELATANETITRIGGRWPIERNPRLLVIALGVTVSTILIYLFMYANRRRLNRWNAEWKVWSLARKARASRRKEMKREKRTVWSKDSPYIIFLRMTGQLD
jgi:hypothetical protein